MSAADLVVPSLSLGLQSPINPLAGYRGRNQILLLLAPQRMESDIGDQLHQLYRMRHELEKRDTLVMTVVGEQPQELRDWAEQIYDVHPQKFTVLLIGKDGSVKMHREQRVTLRDLLPIMDAAKYLA
jgi:hypothetical protein